MTKSTTRTSAPTGTPAEKVGRIRSDPTRAREAPPQTKTPKKKGLALSVRQRKYLRGLKAGLSKKAAALQAGYTREMALNAKEKIEDRCPVRAVLDRWLEREGLSDKALGIGDDDGNR